VASSPAGSDHDVISGFVSGLDHIDLSAIDANGVGGTTNDTFSYIGTAAFGNVAGQLRYDPGTGTLQGDVNGDNVADFVVGLTGVGSVAGTDLVL
jgi:serralysin